MFGIEKPAVGDLVFETEEDVDENELIAEGADDALLAEDKTITKEKIEAGQCVDNGQILGI